jgi:hypothetical protein
MVFLAHLSKIIYQKISPETNDSNTLKTNDFNTLKTNDSYDQYIAP